MEIYLTDICNLTCVFCNIWTKSLVKPTMDLAQIKFLFRQAWYMGVQYVGYSGGEPLLHRDFSEVIRLGKVFGFRQHVTTNATIVTKEKAEAMAESCQGVGVSIDGIGPVFEEIRRTPWRNVERGLNLLIDAGVPVSLGLVITARNIDNVRDVMRYADDRELELGVQPYNKGGIVMPDGMMDDSDLALRPEHGPLLAELMAEFAERIPDQRDYHQFLFDYAMHDSKPTNCYISFEKFVVESNGDIRPCHVFPVLGNVFVTPLRDIWFSKRYDELRNQMMACKRCYLGCFEHENLRINKRLGLLP